MSIRDTIRDADDIESEVVDVPQWGVKLEVRSMTAKARANLLKSAAQEDGSLDFEALYPTILIACCFDPDTGTKAFEAGDSDWLNDKAAGPVERIAQAGMRLSGLAREAVEEGKDTSSSIPKSATSSP